jgi:hypothetical protein
MDKIKMSNTDKDGLNNIRDIISKIIKSKNDRFKKRRIPVEIKYSYNINKTTGRSEYTFKIYNSNELWDFYEGQTFSEYEVCAFLEGLETGEYIGKIQRLQK